MQALESLNDSQVTISSSLFSFAFFLSFLSTLRCVGLFFNCI